MSRKGFLVKVELEVQKITCPGVWLCSNGKVSLQIHMLDSSIQTIGCKPVFPLYVNEKFVFYKTFYNDHRLNELQRRLNNEWFYAELVQWQCCDEGCVLATFYTTLDDLLYPASFRGLVGGMDIDLLMEPTAVFPGTIAPKLEVSTKTTIEETLCDIDTEKKSTVLVNPKILVSAQPPTRKSRPRKVCHSVPFSRAKKTSQVKERKKKPIFQYRKVNDDLILRTNPNVVLNNSDPYGKKSPPLFTKAGPCHCYCYLNRSRSMETLPSQTKFLYRSTSPKKFNTPCRCPEKMHQDSNCAVCSKYEGYFTPISSKSPTCRCLHARVNKPPKLCSYCRQMAKYNVRSSSGSCESDVSNGSKKKVCFCIPSEKANSLAQQLHEKLSKTIDSNSRFFQNCIGYEDI